MRAALVVLLAVLGVAGRAEAAVTVTIQTPAAGARRASPLSIAVTVSSTFDVATVQAQVGASTTNLNAAMLPTWTGTLAVPGLGFGNATLVVTATDVFGTSGSAMVVWFHDEPPVVTITSPLPNEVARPMLHVVASCADDDPVNGCLSFSASASAGGALSGVSIDGMLDLSTIDGAADNLLFRARDSSGNTYPTSRPVFVEASPDLVDVVSLGRRVLDVDATRFLYIDLAGTVRVQPRAGGAESVLGPIAEQGATPAYGRLISTGAVYVSMLGPGPGCGARQETFEWRGGGAPTSLGVSCPSVQGQPWTIVGDWAWHLDDLGRPVRRNVALGLSETLTFPPDVGGPLPGAIVYALARNGDLLHVVRDNNEVRFIRDRGGVQVELGRGTTGAQNNPVFDGLAVAFLEPSVPSDRVALVRAGMPPLVLGDPLLPQYPGQTYDVGGGFVAFTRTSMTSGARQIWRRTPAGDEQNLTPFAADSVVDRMAPDGQLTVITGGQTRYLATGDPGPPLHVGSELGRAVFLGDGVHVVLGRRVLKHGEGAVAVDAGIDAPPMIDAGVDATIDGAPGDAADTDAGSSKPAEGCGGCAGGGSGGGAAVLALLLLGALRIFSRYAQKAA